MNYERDTVLWLFFEKDKKIDPAETDLANLDNRLFADYETILVDTMNREEFQIPTDIQHKSLILALAKVSGKQKRSAQVLAGCKYFKHTAGFVF